MQQQELINHYNKHYLYKNMDVETAKARVNELFPRVQKNDRQAFEEVLGIVREKAYWIVYKRIKFSKHGAISQHGIIENIDDAMQHASLEYAKKSITNFDNFKHDNFYAYSLDFFSKWAENYKTWYCKKVYAETSLDILPALKDNADNYETHIENPEQKLLQAETEEYKNELMRYFIHTLESSLIAPYKLITYCYEFILPMVLKNNHGIRELLDWINKLNVPGKEKASWADLRTGEIGGLITRKSKYLLKWAVNAMYKKKVQYMADEFTSIYNILPLAGTPFHWGSGFKDALDMPDNSNGHNIAKIGELVITDEFKESDLRNWTSRAGEDLLKETVCKIADNPDLADLAVEYAEDLISKRKCKNIYQS